jgi:hypothetical protein
VKAIPAREDCGVTASIRGAEHFGCGLQALLNSKLP